MAAITSSGIVYDVERIRECVLPLTEHPEFYKRASAVMLNIDETDDSLFSSYVAKYNKETDTYVMEYNGERFIHPIFKGTYLEEVYDDVNKKLQEKGMTMGRARILTIGPLRSLRYHRDSEAFRFHIPVWTNEQAFFINNHVVERMPNPGELYEYDTSQYHTAINMSHSEYRTHIVFERHHGLNVI